MDEREAFVRAWAAGVFAMTELCEHFGVSRKTGYKWVRRYEEEGRVGLADRSRAPRSCPHRTAPEAEAEIVGLKRRQMRWGPKKIVDELKRTQPERSWPAVSTAGAILDRAGLVRRRKRRRRWRHPSCRRATAERSNELWTIDFKGEFCLGDRSMCYPLTIQDRWSRYVLACEGLGVIRSEEVRKRMERLFREVGLPERIRSDNGVPFASHGIGGLSRLNVWWMKLGIQHERTDKGRPDQNGAHERMHQELKAETTRPPAGSLAEQQVVFERFRRSYSLERPHEGIGQRRPGELWSPSPRPYPDSVGDPEYPGHFEVRRVYRGGEFKLHSRTQFLSGALAGELIGLEAVDDGVWSVLFGATLLGRYDERKREVFG